MGTLTTAASAATGASVDELDTPSLLIDLDRLERNLRDWQGWMDAHGVRFRPHAKTHKIPDIALQQVALGAAGIACAKVSEAEPFAAAGIKDICIAYPLLGEAKWRRAAELARGIDKLTVNCDSALAVDQASAAAQAAGVVFHLQVDVDSRLHRGGVAASDLDALEGLARHIESRPGVEFDGITTFRFYSFEPGSSREREGQEEGELLAGVARRLRERGLEARNVTAGSSFTGKHVAKVEGITEVRAGTYAFFDLMHLRAGNAREDQVAATVLAQVVSRQGDHFTVDAGSKTLSGERGFRAGRPEPVAKALDRDLYLERLMEEHGSGETGAPLELGERLRLIPYHVCPAVNLADHALGVRAGKVERAWPVAARGLTR